MAKKKSEPWQAALGTNALNPLQAMDLQEAVRNNLEKAEIEGKPFTIKYLPDGKTIFYKPVKGGVPCGYVLIERILTNI